MAGFVEVPAQATAARYPARLFHVLLAAETDRADRPLFVLFNGGPGAATTAGLLPWGTAPLRLSVDGDGLSSNPARLTLLGDLLYVDQRQSGFSYGLGTRDAGCGFDPSEDAGDFVRVLLHVLEANPSIRDHRVVLVGESYGGARAANMLQILLSPDRIAARDPELAAAVEAHHRAVLGHAPPFTREEAARQFGHQVLIQPNVLGQLQITRQDELIAADPALAAAKADAKVDPYDLRHDAAWGDAQDAKIFAVLADPAQTDRLFGVPLGGVAELLPPARATAFRLDATAPSAAYQSAKAALEARFGALRAGDDYYQALACSSWNPNDPTTATLFLEDLREVRTFVTRAKYDLVVRTEAIWDVVASKTTIPVTLDEAPRAADGGRPGWVRLELPAMAASGLSAKTVEVRWPPYAQSGHMVAMTEAEALFADVKAFLDAP
jgi:hypothetical protein